jgi:hypothetical protein
MGVTADAGSGEPDVRFVSAGDGFGLHMLSFLR